MLTPKRVNKNLQYDIFIGRPSVYSNPFVKGTDGTRSEVIAKFKEYFNNHPDKNKLLDDLSGKTIACWCGLNESCHGDILIDLFEERRKLLILDDLFE
jgi:hypothetical protein